MRRAVPRQRSGRRYDSVDAQTAAHSPEKDIHVIRIGRDVSPHWANAIHAEITEALAKDRQVVMQFDGVEDSDLELAQLIGSARRPLGQASRLTNPATGALSAKLRRSGAADES